MIVTAWNNGMHNKGGSGYGFRIKISDRKSYFDRNWLSVFLILNDSAKPLEINIIESFWKHCSELKNKEIGVWLRKEGLAPWPKGNPPKFLMESVSKRHFKVAKK